MGCRRSKEQSARFCSQIWDVALAGRTDTHTDGQTNRKVPPPAKTYRVARALFSRGRLISEASLPVFHGGGEGFGCSLLLCVSFHCKQESPEHTGQACAKREHAATKAGEHSRCEQMQGECQKTWQTRGKGRSTIDFLASCARAFVVSRRRGDSPRPERPQHSEVTLWSPLSSSPRSHC